MADDMRTKLGLNDDDQDKLNSYTDYLDSDQKQQVRDMFQKQMADQGKAVGIASRGMFENKTPEEQQFVNKQLDPGMQGLIGGGGVMGGVSSVGKTAATALQEAAAGAPTALEKFQQMKALLASRVGGYAQRLGAEAKGAAGLGAEAGNTLTGVTGGNMTDAIAKAQMAAKMKYGK